MPSQLVHADMSSNYKRGLVLFNFYVEVEAGEVPVSSCIVIVIPDSMTYPGTAGDRGFYGNNRSYVLTVEVQVACCTLFSQVIIRQNENVLGV